MLVCTHDSSRFTEERVRAMGKWHAAACLQAYFCWKPGPRRLAGGSAIASIRRVLRPGCTSWFLTPFPAADFVYQVMLAKEFSQAVGDTDSDSDPETPSTGSRHITVSK